MAIGRALLRSVLGEPPRPGAGGVPAALAGDEFEAVEADVGTLWFPASDEVMRPYIKATGVWERDEGGLLESLLRPGCRFLDVGANVGYFSVFAAARGAGVTIDAVEPHPVALQLLAFNLWINRVEARVWPVALSNGARSVTLQTAATNLGDTRSDGRGIAPGTTASLVAPAAIGDELFGGRSFDLVKIDVQGAEWEVVSGLAGTIKRSPGIAIVAEFWPAALVERDEDPAEILARYRRLGLAVVTQIGARLERLDDDEILRVCLQSGRDAQVNLLLTDR